MAMTLRPLDELDLVSGRQGHDRLLPVRAPPLGPTHPLQLALEGRRPDGRHLDVEDGLDGHANLDLVRVGPDPKRHRVLFFLLPHALFRHQRSDQDLARRSAHWSGVLEAALNLGWPAMGTRGVISPAPPRGPEARRARTPRGARAAAGTPTRAPASRSSARARCAPRAS